MVGRSSNLIAALKYCLFFSNQKVKLRGEFAKGKLRGGIKTSDDTLLLIWAKFGCFENISYKKLWAGGVGCIDRSHGISEKILCNYTIFGL